LSHEFKRSDFLVGAPPTGESSSVAEGRSGAGVGAVRRGLERLGKPGATHNLLIGPIFAHERNREYESIARQGPHRHLEFWASR